MFLECVGDGWRQGQTAILTELLLWTIERCVNSTHLSLLSHLSWGCSTGGRRGPQPSGVVLSLLVGSHSGLPVNNCLNGRQQLPIFFHNSHLLPFLLRLICTGASLIGGLVKGQYTISWAESIREVYGGFQNWYNSKVNPFIRRLEQIEYKIGRYKESYLIKRTCTHTHVYIYIYIYIYVCVCVCVRVRLCIHIHVYKHEHTYMYTYAYILMIICVYIYTYASI